MIALIPAHNDSITERNFSNRFLLAFFMSLSFRWHLVILDHIVVGNWENSIEKYQKRQRKWKWEYSNRMEVRKNQKKTKARLFDIQSTDRQMRPRVDWSSIISLSVLSVNYLSVRKEVRSIRIAKVITSTIALFLHFIYIFILR